VDDEGGGVKPFHHCRVAEDTGSNTVGAIRLPLFKDVVSELITSKRAPLRIWRRPEYSHPPINVSNTRLIRRERLSPSNRQLNSELSVENMGNVLLGGA